MAEAVVLLAFATSTARQLFIVTQRERAEQRVRQLAYFDALTGLPNRFLFQDRLVKALAGARRRR